jgi:hypothetical protein
MGGVVSGVLHRGRDAEYERTENQLEG